MPNRILRDWTDSHAVNDLTAEEERFFTRLLMKADDFGRFHGQDRLLNASLFPLHKFDDSIVGQWCDACAKAGILQRYKDAKNREYIEILNFKQRTRQQVSKFPNPDDRQLTVNGPSYDRQLTVNGPSIDRLDGDGDGDGDGGGGGQANQPTNQPPSLNQFIQTFKQWPEAKVQEVYESFVAKDWKWGKNKVTDYNEAFAIRLKDRAAKPVDTAIDKSLQRLGESMGVKEIKPNGRLFISELKEKRRVLDDRLKEIKYRGFDEPLGFHYANDDDRQKAKLIKQQLRVIDEQILET